MPNCFTLRLKGEKELSTFQDIDEAICKHFGVPVDPDKYYLGWYDAVGFALAMGKTWDEIREMYTTPDCLAVTNYLAEHYTSDSWYEMKS